MKLHTYCFKCTSENPSYTMQYETYHALSESNLYYFKCPKGHDNLFIFQVFKFEFLFESGLCAINDKYYAESVLSLTASLERFYEFFIRISMRAQDLGDVFETLFKSISKQSERQFGAFLCYYSTIYKEFPPKLMSNKMVEFRNDVIHKGYLPNEEEVMAYAEHIYKIISFYYIQLLKEHKKIILDYYSELQLKLYQENKVLAESCMGVTFICPHLALSHVVDITEMASADFRTVYSTAIKMKFLD